MSDQEWLDLAMKVSGVVKLGICRRGCFTIYVPGMMRCPGCIAFEHGLATGEWVSP